MVFRGVGRGRERERKEHFIYSSYNTKVQARFFQVEGETVAYNSPSISIARYILSNLTFNMNV